MENGLFELNTMLCGIYHVSKLCSTSDEEEIYEAYVIDEEVNEVSFHYLVIHKGAAPQDFSGPISGVTDEGIEYWGTVLPRDPETESAPEDKVYGQLECNIRFQRNYVGHGFKDVAGMDELKARLNDEILFPLHNPGLAKKYRLRSINGMLLWGPPGCGKTFIAEKFAEESCMNYALVKSSDLACIWSHGSQSLVADMFSKAAGNAPCLLCIDEIESLIPRRGVLGGDVSAVERAELCNEFLVGLNNCAERGVFVVATTNNPQLIDPAVLRAGRLEESVYVPAPDMESRKKLLEHELKGRPTEDIDLDALADQTSGYIASDITALANRAALIASKTEVPITMEIMEQARQSVKPSVPAAELHRYELLRKQLEGERKSSCSAPVPAIGFTSSSYGKPSRIVAVHPK